MRASQLHDEELCLASTAVKHPEHTVNICTLMGNKRQQVKRSTFHSSVLRVRGACACLVNLVLVTEKEGLESRARQRHNIPVPNLLIAK